MNRILKGSLAAALCLLPVVAHAFPIALPGTEGLPVLVSGGSPVIATYQGNSAAFSNDLYLMLDALGDPGDDGDFSNDLYIFNNHLSPVGSTVDLGSFVSGTELIFRLHVNDTADDFYTGSPSRNPDGSAHARVQGGWQPSETLVSFEDLFNGPFDFNDLSFSFSNTYTTPVPEPGTLALFGVGLVGLYASSRRRRSAR